MSTYRLREVTSVVVTKNRKTRLITIPEGGVITVFGTPSVETGLVAAKWEDQTVRMLAADLELRAELIA